MRAATHTLSSGLSEKFAAENRSVRRHALLLGLAVGVAARKRGPLGI